MVVEAAQRQQDRRVRTRGGERLPAASRNVPDNGAKRVRERVREAAAVCAVSLFASLGFALLLLVFVHGAGRL